MIRAAYPSTTIETVPDGQGGVWVEMKDVALGAPYVQADSYLIFLLPFSLPGSDIYPMFLRHDLVRLDQAPLGEGFQGTELAWPGEAIARPVVQVSRRTRGSFASQTAPMKIAKVLEWVRTR